MRFTQNTKTFVCVIHHMYHHFNHLFFQLPSLGVGRKKTSLNEKKEGRHKIKGIVSFFSFSFFLTDALLLLIIPHGHFKFMIVPTFW